MHQFSVRLVIAVFAGALAGLVVGLLGRWWFDATWNVFAVASWGIILGSILLSYSAARGDVSRRRGPSARE